MPEGEVVGTESVGGSIADEVKESIAGEPGELEEDGGEGGAAGGPGEGEQSNGEAGGEKGGEADENAEPYTLTAPDGFPVPEENLKSFAEAAHKAGMSKQQAEAMLAWHKELHEKTVQANEAETKELYAAWDKEIRDDPKYGGKNYQKSFAKARKGVTYFEKVSPGARKFLVDTGADKNPHVFRLACELGELTGEDEIVGGSHGGQDRSSLPLYERLYPSK